MSRSLLLHPIEKKFAYLYGVQKTNKFGNFISTVKPKKNRIKRYESNYKHLKQLIKFKIFFSELTC